MISLTQIFLHNIANNRNDFLKNVRVCCSDVIKQHLTEQGRHALLGGFPPLPSTQHVDSSHIWTRPQNLLSENDIL